MRITVQGRAILSGEYTPSSNSNAVLATIAASLLSDQPTRLQDVPRTPRTLQMLDIARQLGAEIVDGATENSLTIQTPHIQTRTLDLDLTRVMPVSTLFLAPLIARRRHARLEWGEPLNRIHTHLTALRDLGQEIEMAGNTINFIGNTWDEQAILLTEMSVTATALVCMLSAILGKKTIIHNAASEPHLRTLQHQLVQMGAKIEGIGSNLLTIYGVNQAPKGSDVILPPDHIEVASIAAIGAMTAGHLSIRNVYLPDLRMILKVYERLGVEYFLQAPTQSDDPYHILHIPEQTGLRTARWLEETDVAVDTAPWPGFPSDLVAMTTVLASQSRGSTLIHEKLYNNRLLFTDKLKGMGASILLCDPHRAIVLGKSDLRGEYIDSPDVRTGLALLGAALCANGKSTIDNAEVFGYIFENVIEKLQGLNAPIKVAV